MRPKKIKALHVLMAGSMALLLQQTSSAIAEDVARGQGVFAKCALCHQVGEGAVNKVGPQLNGVVDAPAASRSGFNYSRALNEASQRGLVWSADNLDAYLTNPRQFLTGGRMAFAGLPDADDRAAVIAYLRTFSGN